MNKGEIQYIWQFWCPCRILVSHSYRGNGCIILTASTILLERGVFVWEYAFKSFLVWKERHWSMTTGRSKARKDKRKLFCMRWREGFIFYSGEYDMRQKDGLKVGWCGVRITCRMVYSWKSPVGWWQKAFSEEWGNLLQSFFLQCLCKKKKKLFILLPQIFSKVYQTHKLPYVRRLLDGQRWHT